MMDKSSTALIEGWRFVQRCGPSSLNCAVAASIRGAGFAGSIFGAETISRLALEKCALSNSVSSCARLCASVSQSISESECCTECASAGDPCMSSRRVPKQKSSKAEEGWSFLMSDFWSRILCCEGRLLLLLLQYSLQVLTLFSHMGSKRFDPAFCQH